MEGAGAGADASAGSAAGPSRGAPAAVGALGAKLGWEGRNPFELAVWISHAAVVVGAHVGAGAVAGTADSWDDGADEAAESADAGAREETGPDAGATTDSDTIQRREAAGAGAGAGEKALLDGDDDACCVEE